MRRIPDYMDSGSYAPDSALWLAFNGQHTRAGLQVDRNLYTIDTYIDGGNRGLNAADEAQLKLQRARWVVARGLADLSEVVFDKHTEGPLDWTDEVLKDIGHAQEMILPLKSGADTVPIGKFSTKEVELNARAVDAELVATGGLAQYVADIMRGKGDDRHLTAEQPMIGAAWRDASKWAPYLLPGIARVGYAAETYRDRPTHKAHWFGRMAIYGRSIDIRARVMAKTAKHLMEHGA